MIRDISKGTLKIIHCYLVPISLAQSSAQKILQRELELKLVNITGICHQKRQMQWISEMIETCNSSRPQKYTSCKKERKVTRIFFLQKEGQQKIQVCQVMSLRTLGFKSDCVMRIALSKTADVRN